MPIGDLEKLKAWLYTCPHWDEAWQAVFPTGFEETSCREDVLGNTMLGCRYKVTLLWQIPGQADEAEEMRKLLDFQNWVQQQSASGLAPRFGDMPAYERIRAEKGGLTAGSRAVTYTITLIADFMKVYEVN